MTTIIVIISARYFNITDGLIMFALEGKIMARNNTINAGNNRVCTFWIDERIYQEIQEYAKLHKWSISQSLRELITEKIMDMDGQDDGK